MTAEENEKKLEALVKGKRCRVSTRSSQRLPGGMAIDLHGVRDKINYRTILKHRVFKVGKSGEFDWKRIAEAMQKYDLTQREQDTLYEQAMQAEREGLQILDRLNKKFELEPDDDILEPTGANRLRLRIILADEKEAITALSALKSAGIRLARH